MNMMPPDLRLAEKASEAAALMKALSHEARLLLLCHMLNGERSVGELEVAVGLRQAAVSQQLARLRLDGLVATRRHGKTIFYRIASPHVERIISALHDAYCPDLPTAVPDPR